jgi:ATP-dependent Clp protease adapter protein ClpS
MNRKKEINNNLESADFEIKTIEEVATTIGIGFASRVILFNDEIHTFEEVINQIVKAINCTFAHAADITNEVHNNGKAQVFEGEMSDCLRVSSVLEEIALHTQIEC